MDNKAEIETSEKLVLENLDTSLQKLWQSLRHASQRADFTNQKYKAISIEHLELKQKQVKSDSQLNSLEADFQRQSEQLKQIISDKSNLKSKCTLADEKISEYEKKEVEFNRSLGNLSELEIELKKVQEKARDVEFAKKEISRLGKEVILRNTEIDNLNNKNASLESKLYTTEQYLKEGNKTSTRQYIQEKSDLIEKINHLVNRNDLLNGENVGLLQELDSLRENISKIKDESSVRDQELLTAKLTITGLENRLENYDREFTELRKKVNSQSRPELSSDGKRVAELENEVNYSSSKLAKAEQILEELSRQIAERDDIIQKLKASSLPSAEAISSELRVHDANSKLMEIIMSKDVEISKIKNELSLSKDKLADLNKRIEDGLATESSDAGGLPSFGEQIKELRNHQKNLENVIENKHLQIQALQSRLQSDEIRLNIEEKHAIAQRIEAVIEKVENLVNN